MKKALVLGAGGFIGSHMVKRLKSEAYYVVGIDLKKPVYSNSYADEFHISNLTNRNDFENILRSHERFDEIYQYAADMGGAAFVFSGENDADLMSNSALINLNVLNAINSEYKNIDDVIIFYSSSACMYPTHIQTKTNNPGLREEDAYPANPDSGYGWEKIFGEKLYYAFHKNYNLNIRIGRFHNTYGPEAPFGDEREKVPMAICRKIALSENVDEIEVWGDGKQTRSFLYIDDNIEATRRLMKSNFIKPINIGSEEMVSINELVKIVSEISNKEITIKHIDGPQGPRGRNSNNDLIKEILDWDYIYSLSEGLALTYSWIQKQLSIT